MLHEASQPIYLEGYHRGAANDPDDAVYTVMELLLSQGRTSRLYRSLVRDQKLAVNASGFNGFPGQKYPSLFTFFAIPAAGHTAADIAGPLHAQIDRLKNEDVTADELQSIKTRAKAALLRSLDSNSGLAENLASVQTRYGDWRELFRDLDRIDKVTAADIRRVSNATFVATNRTVGMVEKATPPAPVAAKGGSK